MLFNQWPSRDSWQLIGFGWLIVGFMTAAVVSVAGESALRSLMLTALIAVFLSGGAIVGRILAYQFCTAHLENAAEVSPGAVEDEGESPEVLAHAPSGVQKLLSPTNVRRVRDAA